MRGPPGPTPGRWGGAASAKSVVSEENCHQFKWGPLLFQHNGHVEDFPRIRRRVLNSLRADVFAAMEGTTDSEACFALILTLLDPGARAVLCLPPRWAPRRDSGVLVRGVRARRPRGLRSLCARG